jgi:hypothetical protein
MKISIPLDGSRSRTQFSGSGVFRWFSHASPRDVRAGLESSIQIGIPSLVRPILLASTVSVLLFMRIGRG